MPGETTLGGVATGLRPVNVWMATLLFAVAIPLFNEWLMEVRDA